MQTMTQVAWWKRLLLAFSATLIWLIVISALFAIIGAARGDEPLNAFFKQGGDAQGGAEIFFIGGYFFALPCFFLIAAPLVLLVPVSLQLRHWYGMMLAAIVPFLLGKDLLGTPNFAVLREKIHTIH